MAGDTPFTTRGAITSGSAGVPPFDAAERDRRWRRVRGAMTERGIDLLIAVPVSSPTDVRYLAQEVGAVLFPLDGQPWIVLGGEDSHLAVKREGWIHQRSSATPTGSTRVPYGAAVAAKLGELKLRPQRVAIAGLDGDLYSHVRLADGYAPYSTVTRIAERLGSAEIVNGSPVMASARLVKSDAELAAIRSSVSVAESSARAISGAFQTGRQQADAYRAGVLAALQPGVEASLAWCPGRWGERRPRIVGTPSGTIDAGLCVAAEIAVVTRGCYAQIAEPFLAGEVNGEQQEAFELNVAAFDATCAALRPGATWRDVRTATVAVAAGTRWKMCFLVHSGPDGPLFTPTESPDAWLDEKVEVRTTLICKSHVFPASQDTEVARSHDVAWGDTVVVENDGAHRLGSRLQRLVPYS